MFERTSSRCWPHDMDVRGCARSQWYSHILVLGDSCPSITGTKPSKAVVLCACEVSLPCMYNLKDRNIVSHTFCTFPCVVGGCVFLSSKPAHKLNSRHFVCNNTLTGYKPTHKLNSRHSVCNNKFDWLQQGTCRAYVQWLLNQGDVWEEQ